MKVILFFLVLFVQNMLQAQNTNEPTELVVPCEQPHYPGGNVAMNTFLKSNLQFDSTLVYGNVSRIYVEFIVDSTGKVLDPKIKKGTGTSIDMEILRVFSIMPDWVPMICGDKKRKTKLILPVRIELK